MKSFSTRTKADIYLEWVNYWLTVDAMADNYGRSTGELEQIINEGREEHEENVKRLKAQ